MYYTEKQIISITDNIKNNSHWNDPYSLAKSMDVTIKEVDFKDQKGVFFKMSGDRFIFVNSNLCNEMKNVVLYHELGHCILHSDDMPEVSFLDSDLFQKSSNKLEYEANLFAAEMSLDDDEVLELCMENRDVYQIAATLNTDINIVALKVDLLRVKGHRLGKVEHKNDFLKY